jgi:hypothetical protein
LYNILKAAYPNVEWKPWKFQQVPKGFWDDVDNRQKFLADFEASHNLRNRNGWNSKLLVEIV